MNELLIDSKYFQLDYWNLIFIVLILSFSVLFTLFIKKRYSKQKHKNNRFFMLIGLWSFVPILLSLLVVPKFQEMIVLENDWLKIKVLGIALIVIILFFNLLILRILRQWFVKHNFGFKKSPYLLLKIILWFISIHFSLKIILVKYDSFIEMKIISIKDVAITISDIFFVFVILFLTSLSILMLKLWLKRQVKRKKIDSSTSVSLLNISKYFIWVIVIVFIFQSVGFNLSILLAGSAALLVGIGMGIQQLFNDFASGLILLVERQVKVGDFIEADSLEGTILEIGFRTSIVKTRDNIRIIIPNSKLVSGNVINWNHSESSSRVHVDVGVAYGSDTQEVRKILFDCATNVKNVIQEPKPEVQFVNFGDSSLDFRLFFYIKDPFAREFIKSDLRFRIDAEFRKAGIQIPFPQVDINFKNKLLS